MAEVVIVDSAAAAGRLVSDHIAEQVQITPEMVLGVATGSTPLAVYRELAQRRARGVDFSRIWAFALDEYVGLPEGHPESYRAVIDREVTGPLGLDPARVHVPDGRDEGIEDCGGAVRGGVDRPGRR